MHAVTAPTSKLTRPPARFITLFTVLLVTDRQHNQTLNPSIYQFPLHPNFTAGWRRAGGEAGSVHSWEQASCRRSYAMMISFTGDTDTAQCLHAAAQRENATRSVACHRAGCCCERQGGCQSQAAVIHSAKLTSNEAKCDASRHPEYAYTYIGYAERRHVQRARRRASYQQWLS